MKLYEIKESMTDTLDILLESEQDQIDKEMYQECMNLLKSELKSKSSNIIRYVNNINADVSALKEEITRLTKLKKTRENKVTNLKSYLVNVMEVLDKKKIETDLGSYGLRKSTSVEIYDTTLLPESCIKETYEVTADKKAISKLIKEGSEIEGAKLVEKYSLQIR